MSNRPDDNRPTVRLTAGEQITFLRVVHHETDPGGRRLLAWVGPGDVQADATPALDAALGKLWSYPPGGETLDGTINLGTIRPGGRP